MMAEDGLEQLKAFDAIYFGAVGWPTVPDHVSLWGLRLKICQGSALAGSLGLGASANLNPAGKYPSMFEPVHGSAPDIAGRGLCNPVGAIGSAALMLEHFVLHDEAKAVQRAIEQATGDGIRTRDVGGTATTAEVTAAVIERLEI